MPTPAPCRPTAVSVASTSCSRRARRCSSHRESRRSRAVLRVASGSRQRDCGLRRASHRLGFHVTDSTAYSGTGQPADPDPGGPDGSPRPARPRSSAGTGSRSPARNSAYAQASNQDMLTATLDGLVARFGLQGEQLGEVVAGAVLKHARDFNLTRESRARLEAVGHDAGLRRPAGLRHRPRGRDPGRQQDRPRARSSPASPAASTPRPTPRSPSATTCAAC